MVLQLAMLVLPPQRPLVATSFSPLIAPTQHLTNIGFSPAFPGSHWMGEWYISTLACNLFLALLCKPSLISSPSLPLSVYLECLSLLSVVVVVFIYLYLFINYLYHI